MSEAVGIIKFNGVQLGTHDSYLTVDVSDYYTTYTVHCDYINTSDATPFYIVSPEQRLAAESYLVELAAALNKTSLTTVAIGKREVQVAPEGVEPSTLVNEWTGLVVEGCYCTDITHEDSGGRYYGFTVQFTKPATDSSTGSLAAFTYKGIDLGNVALGYVETDVSGAFNEYTVVTAYRGANSSTYVSTLANAIGLGHIFKHEIYRGTVGNRGVIKSYDVVSGDLVSIEPDTVIPDVTAIFPQSIDDTQEAVGVLRLTFVFVKAR